MKIHISFDEDHPSQMILSEDSICVSLRSLEDFWHEMWHVWQVLNRAPATTNISKWEQEAADFEVFVMSFDHERTFHHPLTKGKDDEKDPGL